MNTKCLCGLEMLYAFSIWVTFPVYLLTLKYIWMLELLQCSLKMPLLWKVTSKDRIVQCLLFLSDFGGKYVSVQCQKITFSGIVRPANWSQSQRVKRLPWLKFVLVFHLLYFAAIIFIEVPVLFKECGVYQYYFLMMQFLDSW